MRFEQFKINLVEAILDEAEMTPKAFQEFLNSPLVTGMKMGFELEACIHNVRDYDSEYSENDYSYDERVYDIEQIVEFFGNEDANRESDLKKLRNDLYEDFMEWQDAEFDDYLQTDAAQTDLKELIREKLEDLDYDDRQQKLEFEKAEEGKPTDIYAEAEMSALEKIRDEWQDSGDSDFEKYCDVIDMNYMSDVENKYSHYLYWPHQSYSDEDYLNVDWVAEELYSETGIQAYASDSYHGTSRGRAQEQGRWIIEPDSSISTDESEDGGLEFVSPALEINTALEQMKQVLEFIREHGYTNESTGLHINISVPDFDVDNLDYVKLAIFLGDKYVLEQFDRLSNHYCDGAYKKIGGKISQMKAPEIRAVMDKMKEGLTLAASKIIHTGYTNKYTSINTKEGYIEFRSPGGNYLNDPVDKLTNTALRMALALRIATDETMYKQEYEKRLYKLLNDAGEKDDLVKFKDYIAQYQSADPTRRKYIVQTIKLEREARSEKKKRPPGESNPYWMVKRRNGTGGGMAVHAPTAIDAVKDVAKAFDADPVDLYAIPMADEEQEQKGSTIFVIDYNGQEYRQRANRSGDARDLLAARLGVSRNDLTVKTTENPPSEESPASGGNMYVVNYQGTEYRQQANSPGEAKDLLSARTGIERNLLWDIREEPSGGSQGGGVTVDGNRGTGDYQLANSNRSVDRLLRNVDRDTAERTARNMEGELGLQYGSISVQRINTGQGSHNWRIYDVKNPDFFSVVAADSRTDAANRWSRIHPDQPAELVDAVPDEGAMKYEFTIAQQALNPNARGDDDRFIYPQDIYRQRTNFTQMPVRRVWATSKEQAIGKVRSFYDREFFDVPEEWLKINVVGV